jgi:hypothetical protein
MWRRGHRRERSRSPCRRPHIECGEARQRCKDAARPPLTGKAVANADPQGLAMYFNAQLAAGTSGLFANHRATLTQLFVLPLSAVPGCCTSSAPTTGPPVPRPKRPFAPKSQLWQLRRSCSLARAAGPFYDKSTPGRSPAGQARNHRPTGIGLPVQPWVTRLALAPKRRRSHGPHSAWGRGRPRARQP